MGCRSGRGPRPCDKRFAISNPTNGNVGSAIAGPPSAEIGPAVHRSRHGARARGVRRCRPAGDVPVRSAGLMDTRRRRLPFGRAFLRLRSQAVADVGAARCLRAVIVAKRDLGQLLDGAAPSNRSFFQYVRLTGVDRPIFWHLVFSNRSSSSRLSTAPRVTDRCNKLVSLANKRRELRHTGRVGRARDPADGRVAARCAHSCPLLAALMAMRARPSRTGGE